MRADVTVRPDNAERRIRLAAGPLTMELDASSGFVRYVRLGDREVLRGIYVAVRDRNWGTVAPEVSELSIDRGDGGFRVTFTVRCRRAEIDFQWHGEITGAADGAVDYRMDGAACSTFLRNRIGFCVLHAAHACAGSECTIEHVDGSRRQAEFPLDISPGQPFFDVRAIGHEVLPGLTARVLMDGDTFEMEDQRNWTDASFKTYCTPLALPFPVPISEGTRVRQAVSLRLLSRTAFPGRLDGPEGPSYGSPSHVRAESPAEPPITLRYGPACRLPPIGLGMASHGRPLSPQAQSRLSLLGFDHLRVDLVLEHDGFESELHAAAEQARQIGTSLHVAVTLDERSEILLRRLAEAVRATAAPVAAWLLYDRQRASLPASLFLTARTVLGGLVPQAAFGLGTNANFAELNRGRPPAGLADWICYSINPQVHACDDDSLIETLEAQRDTVTSARRFAGTSRIVVSPVTFKPRFNAVATGPEPELPYGELPPQVDLRQATLFAAGWTLGSLAALAGGGVERVTYFETTGWRGVMEVDDGCPLPTQFPSTPGGVFPVWHLLADLAGLAGCELQPVIADAPLRVQGFAARRGDVGTLWLANVTSRTTQVNLPEDVRRAVSAGIRLLDGENVSEAMTSPETFRKCALVPLTAGPLSLPAHALARIDYCPQESTSGFPA